MRVFIFSAITATALLVQSAQAGSLWDIFGSKNSSSATNVDNLPQDQIVSGLKEALAAGVQQAVTLLGKTNGFLQDVSVKIPMPENLRKVEKSLRSLGQEKLADEFVITMNRAAEQAVPEAAAILGDSVKQMNIADARSILAGTNNAATQYFRRTSETNLYARFLPIVKSATEQAGVTAAYKRMTDKLSGGFGGLAALGGNALGIHTPDLDDYITHKALDGLFLKIGEQEKLIRENPVARTTDLLQKVFGTVAK